MLQVWIIVASDFIVDAVAKYLPRDAMHLQY